MTTKRKLIWALAATAVAAVYLYARIAPPAVAEQTAGGNLEMVKFRSESGQHDAIWACPMHPEISQDHPGTCPICGMKLVQAGGSAPHEHGVHVDGATVERLGVRLARVARAPMVEAIEAYGNVAAADNTLYTVHSRYDGWVKKLYVHALGEHVKQGQVLYEIYSPDLITRERSYLSSIDRRKQLLATISTTPATENEYVMDLTTDAARDRAKLHVEEGVSVETIRNMEDSKQVVEVSKMVAGSSGVVTQINVREGSFVTAATPLLTLADVSKIWIDVSLYPDQAGMVTTGDPVTVQSPDGLSIPARLDFVAPVAENNSVRARVYLDNSKYHLRPGAYVDVTIGGRPHEALSLPRSAIMYTARGKFVMLSRGDGHFLPIPVETGFESNDSVEIVSGLREGAEVAVNGQFLLDAASSMNAAAERMHTH